MKVRCSIPVIRISTFNIGLSEMEKSQIRLICNSDLFPIRQLSLLFCFSVPSLQLPPSSNEAVDVDEIMAADDSPPLSPSANQPLEPATAEKKQGKQKAFLGKRNVLFVFTHLWSSQAWTGFAITT